MKDALQIITAGPRIQIFPLPEAGITIAPPRLYSNARRTEWFKRVWVTKSQFFRGDVKYGAVADGETPIIYDWQLSQSRLEWQGGAIRLAEILNPDEFLAALWPLETAKLLMEFDRRLADQPSLSWESESPERPAELMTLLAAYAELLGTRMPGDTDGPVPLPRPARMYRDNREQVGEWEIERAEKWRHVSPP